MRPIASTAAAVGTSTTAGRARSCSAVMLIGDTGQPLVLGSRHLLTPGAEAVPDGTSMRRRVVQVVRVRVTRLDHRGFSTQLALRTTNGTSSSTLHIAGSAGPPPSAAPREVGDDRPATAWRTCHEPFSSGRPQPARTRTYRRYKCVETTCGSQARAQGNRGWGCADGAGPDDAQMRGECGGGGGRVGVKVAETAAGVVGVAKPLKPRSNRQGIARSTRP